MKTGSERQRIVTIGVYGFDAKGFFEKLTTAKVDTFCDIRARRGVRGSAFAFANSKRLQARLAELGIRYLHFTDLAPAKELRDEQAAVDKATHTAKRKRSELSPAFVEGYREQCLKSFRAEEFMARLGADARVIALFCVERDPAACHRSLLAEQIQRDLKLEVEHLKPA